MKARVVTVDTTAAIIADGVVPCSAIIRNNGATTLYIGGSDVDGTDGFSLAQGAAVQLDLVNEKVYGVTASSTTTVSIIATGSEAI